MKFVASVVVGCLSLASTAVSLSPPTVISEKGPKVIPGAFIYEFEDGYNANDFINTLGDEGTISNTYNYELFKGVAIRLHNVPSAERTAARIAEEPRIKNVWPVYMYPRPEADLKPLAADSRINLSKRGDAKSTADAQFNEKNFFVPPHVQMQVDKLHKNGVDGKGVKIAVVDSGVDYKHPALGGCFGKGCLISFGYDLVGDDYGRDDNPPKPSPDPMDCGGHGTHVTGIIAAQPNDLGFIGVAPNATIGHYRVFGCEGGVGGNVLFDAINMAYDANSDIITMSLGAGGGWVRDGLSEILSRMVDKKGIVALVAGGNGGGDGAFNPSSTSDGRRVLSISSFDNSHSTSLLSASHYLVGNTATKFGYAAGNPSAWGGVKLPLYAVGFNTSKPDDGCAPYPATTPDLADHVVVIRRGTCTFVEKAKNAAAKGAKYMILYNNDPDGGAFGIGVDEVKQIKAAAMVPAEVGITWVKALERGDKVSVDMIAPDKAERVLSLSKNTNSGGAVSGFSSWGPTLELIFKPQFGAPGGGILSTLPRHQNLYGTASGTSMSTPMVAGVSALIRQVRGRISPDVFDGLLSSTARPERFHDGSKFYDYLAPTPQQGSGLVQAYDAAYATTLVQPASLAFNDTVNLRKDLTITIHNTGKSAVRYHIGNKPAATFYTLAKGSISLPKAPNNERIDAPAKLLFENNELFISAGHSATIPVRLSPPQGIDQSRLPVYSGWITVKGSDNSSLNVPYMGLATDFRTATTIASDGSWLTNSTDNQNKPLPAGTKFLLPKPGTARSEDGIPGIIAIMPIGTKNMVAQVVSIADASKPTVLGELPFTPFTYLNPRSGVKLEWDGKLKDGTFVKGGDYKIRIGALKIHGDINKDTDYNRSETPLFSIQYKE